MSKVQSDLQPQRGKAARRREVEGQGEGCKGEREEGREAEKTCSKCGLTKALDAFPRHPRGKLGRNSVCRKCRGIQTAEWKRTHPVQAKAIRARCWLKHREKNLEKKKAYRESNKDKIRSSRAERYPRDREKIRAYQTPERMRKWSNARTERLADAYIRQVLCTKNALSAKDITDTLVSIQRAHLRLKRHIQQQTKL